MTLLATRSAAVAPEIPLSEAVLSSCQMARLRIALYHEKMTAVLLKGRIIAGSDHSGLFEDESGLLGSGVIYFRPLSNVCSVRWDILRCLLINHH